MMPRHDSFACGFSGWSEATPCDRYQCVKRIAIIGSFSTGKTTLAEAAAPKLGLPLLPEVAREVVDLGFKLDKDATVETETLIFLRQFYNEMSHPSFVVDRSL